MRFGKTFVIRYNMTKQDYKMMENSLSGRRRRFRGRIDRALLAIVCTVVAIGAGACASSSKDTHFFESQDPRKMNAESSMYLEVEMPSTPEVFFHNLKFAIDHDLLVKHDFYTKEYMHRFFAAEKIAVAIVHDENGDLVTGLDAADFDGIFPRVRDQRSPVSEPGAQIAATYLVSPSGESQGTLNLVFPWGALTFDQAKALFGGTWILNKATPLQPPLPATGLHGNERWNYVLDAPSRKITGYFMFDGAGLLLNVVFKQAGVK